MKVTVITSTIGRPELRRCLESVQAQTYPGVKHNVYVNGPGHHAHARRVLEDYPAAEAFYLPADTGAYNGSAPSCAGVFAAAPFLTDADWVFFLNDDDFYDADHVESIMALAKAHDLGWAYSLRRFVTRLGEPIVDDDWCSLGHSPILGTSQYVVDNSCFAVRRDLAERYGQAWTVMPIIGDRAFLMALKESGARAGCTGRSTLNYRTGTGSAEDDPPKYLQCAEAARKAFPHVFPWRRPWVFDGQSAKSLALSCGCPVGACNYPIEHFVSGE